MASSFSLCDSEKLLLKLRTASIHYSRNVSLLSTRVTSACSDVGTVLPKFINSVKEQSHNSLSNNLLNFSSSTESSESVWDH